MNNTEIDIVDIGRGRYVLISENRINFVSDIINGDIEDILAEERAIIKIQELSDSEVEYNPSIAFIPTLDCNLRCVYCYARGGDDKIYMSQDLAKSAIDALINSRENHKNEVLTIYFLGGGEPLLNFDCMKYIVEYAKINFREIEISIVTNGTFNKNQADWLIRNNIATRISYDGLAHRQQRPFKNGRNSQILVEKNIKLLVKAGLPLTIQLTVTKESTKILLASVSHLVSLGVKYIKIGYVHNSAISRGEKDLVPDIKAFADIFIRILNLILEKKLDIKIENSFISRPTSGYYCGAGSGENKTIIPTGEITACVEIARPHEKYSDIIIYGKVNENNFIIDQKKRVFLDKLHYLNFSKCRRCNLKLICGGDCPMQAAWDNNDFFTPSKYSCNIHKLLLPRLFNMVFENEKVLDVLFDNQTTTFGC